MCAYGTVCSMCAYEAVAVLYVCVHMGMCAYGYVCIWVCVHMGMCAYGYVCCMCVCEERLQAVVL